MRYYNIPLERSERASIEVYAKKWQTYFEKLAIEPLTGEQFPLVAGLSRSTVRVLVSLQDMNAFSTPSGEINYGNIQILTNCIMAFMVHASHHSTIEVAEVYAHLYLLQKNHQSG